MKTARYALFGILCIGFVVCLAGYALKNSRTISNLREELAEAQTSRKSLLEEKLLKVRTGDVRATGKIEASEAVAISPQVEAPIKRILVRESELVEAGQALAELDETGPNAALQERIAALHRARREEENIRRLFPMREELYHQQVEEVELAYHNAIAEFEKALGDTAREVHECELVRKMRTQEVDRMRALASDGLTPKEDLEQAELEIQCAELAEADARARLKDLQRTITFGEGEPVHVCRREAELDRERGLRQAEEDRLTENDLRAAEARTKECALLVDLAKQSCDAVRICAPIRGIVTAASDSPRLAALTGSGQGAGRALSFEELREVGKRVGLQDVLFVIEGLEDVVVKVDVDEMDINRVKVGAPVRIRGVGFANVSLKGEVAEVSPEARYVAESKTTFEATVKVLEDLGPARLGMSTEVDIQVGGDK